MSSEADSHPKEFAFAIWLLFINNVYGEKIAENPEFNEDINLLWKATLDYDREYREGHSYEPEYFPQIVYPKLMPAWLARKGHGSFDLGDFYEWVIPVGRRLLAENGDPFHLGLVLKMAVAASKESVRQGFRAANLRDAINLKRQAEVLADETARRVLRNVLRAGIEVEMDKPERLTGGWSSAHVWRVRASYILPLVEKTDERQKRRWTGEPLSMTFVIKTGPRDNFTRAADLYRRLDSKGRELFPAHDARTSVIDTPQGPTFYMFMEELSEYVSIGRRIRDLLPEDHTAALPMRDILNVVKVGLGAINALHQVNLQAKAGAGGIPRSHYVRLGRMYESIDAGIRASAAVRKLAGQRMTVIQAEETTKLAPAHEIVKRIMNLAGKIVVQIPNPGTREAVVHGDCHAHNIMLREGKWDMPLFVDIDGLRHDDYLLDYAEYAAHICYTLGLEELTDDDIGIEAKGTGSSTTVRVTMAERPGHKVFSEMWKTCMQEVELRSEKRNDLGAVNRWRALVAQRLLYIAAKAEAEHKRVYLFLTGLRMLNSLAQEFKQKNREKREAESDEKQKRAGAKA